MVPIHLDSGEGVAVVLTRHTVKGGKGKTGKGKKAKGLGYYTNDESLKKTKYYMDGDGEAEGQKKTSALGHTVWMGTGAAAKGLVGEVDLKDFEDVALGYAPDTDRKVRIRGPVPKERDSERLLFDNTYSPPKSVTIGALVFGNEEILHIYRETIAEMVELTEERYAIARVQVNGVRQEIKTGNLTIAGMEHYTSRPVFGNQEISIDAQLHTHVLVANSTLCPDGVHRAIYSEKLMWVKGLNEIFLQKLATKLQAAGFALRVTENGFELADISDRDIEVFSKRTVQAKARAVAVGDELTPANIKHHAHAMRQAKNIPLTLEELQEIWRAEAQAHGITAPVKQSRPVKPLGDHSVVEALDLAIAHWSERSVSFSQENIELFVFAHPQQFGVEALEDAIQNHPQLIQAKFGRYTTVEAIQREREIYYRWRSGERLATPLVVTNLLENKSLSLEQQSVVINTLLSEDKHQIWQGFSGVGKTRSLRALKDELEAQGIVVSGYATTHAAAKVLSQELGIPASTVAQLSLATPEPIARQYWIIDEASLVGARTLQTVLQRADQVNARILLVGDKGQNSSVEAGSPFRFLQRMGRTVHRLTQIRRQQDRSQRAAVQLFAEGKGKEGFEILESEGYIHEIANAEDRASAIASQYLTLSPKERRKTLVVAGTNQERQAITDAIRTGLTDERSLHSAVDAVQLVSKQFTIAQAQQLQNYQVGDFIKLHHEYKTTPLKKNVLYKVEGIKGDQLVLSSLGGRSYRLDPSKYTRKTVYRAESIKLAVGDRIRRTAATKKKGQFSGQQLVIAQMKGTGFVAVDQKGHKHEISLMKPLEVDHDWVSTTYRAQGKTIQRSIVSATIDPTSSREPFYVGISRQEKFLTVYTEDLEELRDWVGRSNVQENAIDLLQGDPHESGLNGVDANPDQYAGRTEPVDAAADQRTGRAETIDATTNRIADGQPSGTGTAAHPGSRDGGRPLQEFESSDHDGLERDAHHRENGAGPLSGGAVSGAGRGERQQDGGGDRQDGQGDRAGEELNRTTESRSGSGDGSGTKRPEENGHPHWQVRESWVSGNAQSDPPELSNRNTIRLSQAIQAYRERRELATSGLIEQIVELTEELESVLSESHPSMDRLAEQILDRRQNREIAAILPQISELLQAFNEDNTVSLDSAKVELMGDALDEWQAKQVVADALNQGNPNQINEAISQLQETANNAATVRLAKAIQQRQERLEMAEAISQLSDWVEELEPSPGLDPPDRREGMQRLAKAIRGRQDKNAVADVMVQVAELVEQLETSSTPAQNRMERFAQAILKRQEHLQVQEAMEQVTDLVQELDVPIDQAMASQGMDRLAKAIQGRDQRKQFIEAVDLIAEVIDQPAEPLEIQEYVESLQVEGQQRTKRFAQAILKRQECQEVVDALEQVTELAEQLRSQEGSQPVQTNSMSRLAQAIQDRRDKADLTEGLANVAEIIEDLVPGAEPQNRSQQLGKAIRGRWHRQDLALAMEQVAELMQGLENATPPAPKRMERLAQAILKRRENQEVTQAIEQVTALIEQLDPPQVEVQASQGTKRLAKAIQERRQHQGIHEVMDQVSELLEQLSSDQSIQAQQQGRLKHLAEAILNRQTSLQLGPILESIEELLQPTDPQIQTERLAQAIKELHEQRSLVSSGLLEQMADLAETLTQQQNPQAAREGMQRLAAAIQNRRAEHAIANHLKVFEELSQGIEQWAAEMPELKQLADIVEEIEAMAISDSASVKDLNSQLKEMGVKITSKPKLVEVFWEPNYDGQEAPRRVDPEHWEEMKGSCIQFGLLAKNCVSIEGSGVLERLLEDKFLELGAGQEMTRPMRRLLDGIIKLSNGKWVDCPELGYNRVAEGGWWGMAGVDPITFEQSRWGCFKPDNPRVDSKKTILKGTFQYRKYEHPYGPPRELYLANIPDRLEDQIFAKHGVTPRPGENFWQTVVRENLPIVITEGFKKTLASLSQGHITIGLSGTNGSYHAKDAQGRRLAERVLNDLLKVFATEGREITFALDQDQKVSSILNVRRDLVRGIELLEQWGCICKVARWRPEQGKGVDDLIAQSGPRAYENAIRRAISPEQVVKAHYRTLYNSLVKTTKNDVEVYIQAIRSGDIHDGDRVIRQSTKARKLRKEEGIGKLKEYLGIVKQEAIRQLREGMSIPASLQRRPSRGR